MPRMNGKPIQEIIDYGNKVIKNHVTSIIRKTVRHNNLFIYNNQKNKDNEDNEFQFVEMAFVLNEIFCSNNCDQESVCRYNKLVEDIKKWSSGNEFAEKLTKEIIDPSDDTLILWNKMVERHLGYKVYDMIPPSSLSHILGANKTKVNRVIVRLRKHLTKIGYEIEKGSKYEMQ